MSGSLFACTKCHHKFPFGKLSGSLMQCSGCKEESNKFLGPTVCTYCREEYNSGGDDSSSICPKCQANVKQYGKPRACEICNIIAAFIGGKCKRCVVSEDKWGSPVTCEQCKQKCAFNRDDRSKQKVDRKVLCWLCTIAYKRVLAKTRKKENAAAGYNSESQSQKRKADASLSSKSRSSHHHRPDKHSSSSTNSPKKMKHSASTGNLNGTATTKSKESASDSTTSYMHDMNIVLVTQLREEVESLKKTLAVKEKELLDKERKMTEFKTLKMETDKLNRDKLETIQKRHSTSMDTLQGKYNELLRQVATLSKASRRSAVSNKNSEGNNSNNGSPATR